MTQVYQATGANDTPVLVPGWTVQSSFSGANGGSNQGLTAGGAAAGAGGFGVAVPGNNFLAQSLQMEDVSTTQPVVPTSGSLLAAKVILDDSETVSNVSLYVGTAGSSYTTTHGWAVIVDMNGNIRAQSADLTSAVGAASAGIFTQPLTSSVNLSGGYYYVGLAFAGSGTTAPKFAGANTSTGSLMNLGLTAATGSAKPAGYFRFATLATGITTALPSSPITLSSMTADNSTQLFVALS